MKYCHQNQWAWQEQKPSRADSHPVNLGLIFWPLQALISPSWGKLKWSLLQIPHDVTYVWSLNHITNEPIYKTEADTDRLVIDVGVGVVGWAGSGREQTQSVVSHVSRAGRHAPAVEPRDYIQHPGVSHDGKENIKVSKMISPQWGPARGRSCFSLSLLSQAVQILNGAVILALGGCMHALQNLSQASNYFFLLIVSTGYPIWGAIFVSIQIPLTAYHY